MRMIVNTDWNTEFVGYAHAVGSRIRIQEEEVSEWPIG
ncbi:hypothetical protein BN931_587 [Bifidobacterium animalis subsp. lactis CECT 8145]|nr:hypothetical protein M8PIadj_1003 [Bifidobacterium animalis]CDL71394.1 hypothetical protein BN931_587 [Bifidobacterium animalis subsp. lactis CECT 8145]